MDISKVLLVFGMGSEQAIGLCHLWEYLQEDKGYVIEGWEPCDNGCCCKVYCEGFDETSWGVDQHGMVFQNDRYGNIEYMEFVDDDDA